MVYSNKFVLSVLVNGHIQKELSNGVVPLPFNAEYVLRFRNKHNRRAVVKFYIDGECVSGSGYIIEAQSHTDIRRHRDVDKAFKFVSLESEDAIDHGKNGPNDDKIKGTIEARFYLEKERPAYVPPTYVPVPVPCPQPYPVWPRPYHDPYRWLTGPQITFGPQITCDNNMRSGVGGSSASPGGETSQFASGGINNVAPSSYREISASSQMHLKTSNSQQSHSCHNMMDTSLERERGLNFSEDAPGVFHKGFAPATPLQDGCTVEGSVTGQSFRSVDIDIEENCTILKVFLQGTHVTTPVVSSKPTKAKENAGLTDLEAENERLRKELAEEENRLLKEKLAALKKPAKKAVTKKKTIKKE